MKKKIKEMNNNNNYNFNLEILLNHITIIKIYNLIMINVKNI